jgi:hypothetical protein
VVVGKEKAVPRGKKSECKAPPKSKVKAAPATEEDSEDEKSGSGLLEPEEGGVNGGCPSSLCNNLGGTWSRQQP